MTPVTFDDVAGAYDTFVGRWTRAFPARLTIQAATPSALTIRFHPQGTSSGSDLRLTSGAVTYHVTVDAVTGRVRNQRE